MTLKGIIVFVFFYIFISNQSIADDKITFQSDSVIITGKIITAAKYLQHNEVNSAGVLLKEMKQLIPAINGHPADDHYQIKYLKLYQDFLFRKKRYRESIKSAQQLLILSTKMKDKFNIAESYYAIASAQVKMGQWGTAAENITKALKTVESLNSKKEQGKYYFLLSDIFFELREGKKSLYYSTKAYEVLKATKNSDFLKERMNIALMEILSGQHDLALRHLHEAERNIDKGKEPFLTARIHLYLSHVYYKKKEYKLSLGQLNKIPYYYSLITPDASGLKLHTEMAMAETLCGLKSYESAKYYFNRNISRALKEMDTHDVRDCLELGAKIYEGTGDNAMAFSYLKKYSALSDSLNNSAMRKAIHETDIKYQTTLKEKAISDQKLLLIKKDYELHRKNRYILAGITSIVLLLLASFIAYLIYRNKNQSIELSLLKAQIHPHFLFNTLNNLYALSINKSDQAPAVVLGLANILRYILYECNALNADLKKEMEIIEEYILLGKVRYDRSLEVNTHIESDLSGYVIAPLLLLPLVENAYKHGVDKLEKDAWINIHARITGNRFVLKISNNKPVEVNKNSQKSAYGNIGLKNIRKRLDILYPKKHKFRVTDSGEIFLVTIEVEVKRN